MINMLIAMMAKTFDNIHEESTVNFNFLRAKIIHGWIEQHPSPPPVNLVTLLVGGPMNLLLQFLKRGRRGVASSSVNLGADGHDANAPSSSTTSPPPHQPPKTERAFKLVADYLDVNHTRKLAMLLTSYIGDAVAIEPAPGVKELRDKLDAHVAAQEKATQQMLEQQAALLAIVQQRLPTNLGGDLGYLAKHAASFGPWDRSNAGGVGVGGGASPAAVDHDRSPEFWRRGSSLGEYSGDPQWDEFSPRYSDLRPPVRPHRGGSLLDGIASEVRDGVSGIRGAFSGLTSCRSMGSSASSVGQRIDRFFDSSSPRRGRQGSLVDWLN